MSTPVDTRAAGNDRYDLHNTSIDEAAAKADLCATVDLQNGRVCVLPALHHGGCQFAPRDQVQPHDTEP